MDEFKYPQLSKLWGFRTYGTILFVISIIAAVVVVIGGIGAECEFVIISLIIGAGIVLRVI